MPFFKPIRAARRPIDPLDVDDRAACSTSFAALRRTFRAG
jgi:hypothetical protein